MNRSGTAPSTERRAMGGASTRRASTAAVHHATRWYVAVVVATLVAMRLIDQSRRRVSVRRWDVLEDEGAPSASIAHAASALVATPVAEAAARTSSNHASEEEYTEMSRSPRPVGKPAVWTTPRRVAVAAQVVAALALIALALAPPVLALAERNVRVHHLEHAALLVGGGVLGLVLGWLVAPSSHGFPWPGHRLLRQNTLTIVLLGPLVVMAAMIPSTSSWVDAHPLVHSLEHLSLIILGGVIAVSARLFSAALGWLVVALIAAMAAAFGGMVLNHPLGLVVAGVGAIVMLL